MATNRTRVYHPDGTLTTFNDTQSYRALEGAIQITERVNSYSQDIRVTLIPWSNILRVVLE